jgi:hypothetical protein
MEDKKLFIVEFGKPEHGMSMSFMDFHRNQPPVYVIAKDYNEAASKGLAYAEYKKQNTPQKNVIDSDGSLNNFDDDDEIKVKAVRLAAEEIVW